MLFSSMLFIWIFLPTTLILYYFIDQKYKNILLLLASLIFYAWGEPRYILLMVISIIINYYFGILIEDTEKLIVGKVIMWFCVCVNIGILIYFKYFNFIIENINKLVENSISIRNVVLPIGISFYTFQALSYVVDIYRSKNQNLEVKAQRNLLNLALYISFFPQLIAGPIVKYHDIDKQLSNRVVDSQKVAYGIKRFIYGLGKKVLISNVMARTADSIFALDIHNIGTVTAWIGIISYSLQIYYDFSGYSDMAIGLGKIFGFDFVENFNYPYISKSISEFWRRWHISLSTWFREYIYIPLGGNRKGKYRTGLNLFIIFLITGIWHGASWNFIIWGIFHGIFIVLERYKIGEILKNNRFKIINQIYTLLVVMFGWVFFRMEDISESLKYLKILIIPTNMKEQYSILYYLNKEVILVLIIAILFAGWIQEKFPKFKKMLFEESRIYTYELITLSIILILCIITLTSGTYNPFIYFRF